MRKIEIIIKPNAKIGNVEKLTDNAFKVSVKSPPKDGKANKEMIEIISNYLGVHQNEVKIIFGWKSRRKILQIKDT